MVQFGLDSQYPRLRLLHRERWPRRVGGHRRPPGLPVLRLRTRCRPWPCGRLSRPRTTTAAPPHPGAHSRQRTCPPPAWPAGGEGSTWAVPTFVLRSVDGGGGQLCPSGLATGTPQAFPVASWPALTTGISVARSRGTCAATRPRSTRLEPVLPLRGFTALVPHVHLPVLLAGPGPSGSADPSRRCRGCSHPPLHSQGRAAPSFTSLLRQAGGRALASLPDRLTPRGARSR